MRLIQTIPLGAGLAILSLVAPALHAEQIVFSEIHYHPQDGKPEYLEIHNLTGTPFDIANWKLSDGVDYEFPAFDAVDPAATYLQPFEYIVVSPVDEATFRAAYPISSAAKVFGPWTGALDNSGEHLALEDKNGVLRAEIRYDDDGRKWPVAADGAGHSLRLAKPDRVPQQRRNVVILDARLWKVGDLSNLVFEVLHLGVPFCGPSSDADLE